MIFRKTEDYKFCVGDCEEILLWNRINKQWVMCEKAEPGTAHIVWIFYHIPHLFKIKTVLDSGKISIRGQTVILYRDGTHQIEL